jgi:colanic acid biosynthesis glycosyl transferase WcaI
MTSSCGGDARPLRVIVWGINYAPELTGIAPYNTALCQYLHRGGHDVRMVTSFSYYPAWRKSAGDRGRLYRTDRIGGVPVHRCWHYVPARVTSWKRIVHEASFVLSSLVRQFFLPRPDVIVVVSPPLLLGAAAWLIGVARRVPFVFHVQDLQPDAATSLGMLRPGLLIRMLYFLERLAYSKAALVSGISGGMLEAFARKGTPASKQVYFPNGVDLSGAAVPPAVGRFRARHGFAPGDFLAVYSGNLGVKQGLEILVEAARLVRDSRVKIVICGDGSRRARLAELVVQAGLGNVAMLPLQPAEEYREMLRDADVCLITQQRGTGQFFLPSKLLGALALARPVISVGDEASELVKAARAGRFGVNVLPGAADRLAAVLDDLAAHPRQLCSMGESGRRYVEQFDFEAVHRAFEAELWRASGRGRPGLAK